MVTREIYKDNLIRRAAEEDTDAIALLQEFYPELGEVLDAYAVLVREHAAVNPNEVEQHGRDERDTALEQAAALADKETECCQSCAGVGNQIRKLMD